MANNWVQSQSKTINLSGDLDLQKSNAAIFRCVMYIVVLCHSHVVFASKHVYNQKMITGKI